MPKEAPRPASIKLAVSDDLIGSGRWEHQDPVFLREMRKAIATKGLSFNADLIGEIRRYL